MSENDCEIYVSCLSSYNHGILHGEWIDACLDVEEIDQNIKKMLACSPMEGAEEFAIHDHDGFGGYEIGEFMNVQRVHDIACFINAYPKYGVSLLKVFNDDLEQATSCAENCYAGCYTSTEDYAMQLAEEHYQIPAFISPYVDYQRWGEELLMDYVVIKIHHDELHLFHNQ